MQTQKDGGDIIRYTSSGGGSSERKICLGSGYLFAPGFPSLRFGLAQFQGGFLITNDKDVIGEVLQHADYMRFIFPVAVDLDLTPTPSLDEDE